MKKSLILIAAVIFSLAITKNVAAQITATSSTNVKIILTDFITTESTTTSTTGTTPAAGAEVVFNYPDAASYTTDQTVTKTGHLKVTATKTFSVTVKAAGANFVNGANNIPVSVLSITPTAPGSGTATPVTSLSTTDQTVLSGVTAGIKTIDVAYKITSAQAQANILGKASGTYQQTVVYTFTQP